MDRAEVVVVGAGLAGASVAWWLAREAGVLLLEQGGAAGGEATAQNAGMLRRLVREPVERALACRAVEILDDLPGPAWRQALRRTGGVVATAGPPGPLELAAEDLRARGVIVDAPPAPPALSGAALTALFHVPGDGLLDPHALMTGLLAEARGGGARVQVARRVTALRVEGGRVSGVETTAGPVAAEVVVLATGAWGAWLAARAGLRRALVPLARTLLQSDPHPVSTPEHPWCWLDDVGLYVRPEAGGWLLSPCDERPVAPPDGPGSAGPVEPLGRALAMEKLERLPALAGLRLRAGWSGLRTFAVDRHPWLGPDPEVKGLFWASGLGGFGVSAALAVGEVVRARLLDLPLGWLDVALVDPGRVARSARLPAGASEILPAR